MPVTLKCSCGHLFDMPTARFQRDGARCPKCRTIVLTRVKPKRAPDGSLRRVDKLLAIKAAAEGEA